MKSVPDTEPSFPQYAPEQREIDDLELMRTGALSPSDGFGEHGSQVTLEAPVEIAESAEVAGGLGLTDSEGVLLATLTLANSYEVSGDTVGMTGRIELIARPTSRPFGSYYLSTTTTNTMLGDDALIVPVRQALSENDIEKIRLHSRGPSVLFLALVGCGTPVGISDHGLIRATNVVASSFDHSGVIAVPVAKRSDSSEDQAFIQRVVTAYAHHNEIFWPSKRGKVPADVQKVVDQDKHVGLSPGVVVFFTGLSGSGKSTLAQALRNHFLETGTRTVSLLDGDRVRRNLSAGLTFSAKDRETNIERIGWVAAEISRHGGMAICSPIAPFDRTRRAARKMTGDAGGHFVLIHVATPLDECERRDRKGLYAKARRGEVNEFTGISSPYEDPEDADLIVDTTNRTVGDVLDDVLELLVGRDLIPAESDARSGAVSP